MTDRFGLKPRLRKRPVFLRQHNSKTPRSLCFSHSLLPSRRVCDRSVVPTSCCQETHFLAAAPIVVGVSDLCVECLDYERRHLANAAVRFPFRIGLRFLVSRRLLSVMRAFTIFLFRTIGVTLPPCCLCPSSMTPLEWFLRWIPPHRTTPFPARIWAVPPSRWASTPSPPLTAVSPFSPISPQITPLLLLLPVPKLPTPTSHIAISNSPPAPTRTTPAHPSARRATSRSRCRRTRRASCRAPSTTTRRT